MVLKTHHFSIASLPIMAIVEGWQTAQGQSVTLTDPVVWSQVFAFAMTIVGLLRNKPQ